MLASFFRELMFLCELVQRHLIILHLGRIVHLPDIQLTILPVNQNEVDCLRTDVIGIENRIQQGIAHIVITILVLMPIKYHHKAALVIRELGYPNRHMRVNWYKQYEATGTLTKRIEGRQKFTEQQKQIALQY